MKISRIIKEQLKQNDVRTKRQSCMEERQDWRKKDTHAWENDNTGGQMAFIKRQKTREEDKKNAVINGIKTRQEDKKVISYSWKKDRYYYLN